VIWSGTGAALIVSGNVVVAVCGVEHESVALICGLNAPLVDGVPLIRPALEIVTPVGKEPANRDHVTAPIPPLLVIWKLYGLFCVPEGRDVVAIESAVQDTVMENEPLAFAPRESATLIVGVLVPIVVGVPDIAPPEANVKPAGRLPEVIDQV